MRRPIESIVERYHDKCGPGRTINTHLSCSEWKRDSTYKCSKMVSSIIPPHLTWLSAYSYAVLMISYCSTGVLFMICATTVQFKLYILSYFPRKFRYLLFYCIKNSLSSTHACSCACPPLQGHHHINQPIEDTFLKV